jgi:hypothetical protein
MASTVIASAGIVLGFLKDTENRVLLLNTFTETYEIRIGHSIVKWLVVLWR